MERNAKTGYPGTHPARGWRRPVGWVALWSLLALTLNPLMVLAQDGDVLIKPGDILDLEVPGRPDLSSEMTVAADGTVMVPQVGEVEVAGLDLDAASTVLKQKIRLFVPTLDSLDLDIRTQAGNPRVYVIGQVVHPGAHTFNVVPSIWDVLRAAGGPNPKADLRAARVIREEDGTPEVHPVNLSGLLDGTDIIAFQLRDGDTLIIPELAEGVSGVPSQDGVKVFGSVAVPTVVPMSEPMPLLDVLMLAGAPTESAKLEEIYWVHTENGTVHSTQVDLHAYLTLGDPVGNPLVYPGDTLTVQYRKPSWVRANVPFILGSLAAMATIYLALDNIIYRNE